MAFKSVKYNNATLIKTSEHIKVEAETSIHNTALVQW